MKKVVYSSKWKKILKQEFSQCTFKTLAARPEAATFLLIRQTQKSVLRLVDLEHIPENQLRFEWNFLTEHHTIDDFPSQRPINFFNISENIKGLELSFLEGTHPRVNSKKDFYIFGQTLAKFHKVSKSKHYKTLPSWNSERVIKHFSNPVLMEYFTEKQKEVAFKTIEKIASVFENYWNAGEWTGIVHSDTHKHNILIENGKGYLIDFAECGKGVLFWDLGVAIADTEMDYPKYASQCRRSLLEGYFSILPETKLLLKEDLEVFTKLRVLEVMTWPVSDWTKEYREQNFKKAKENIKDCIEYLEAW